MSEPEKPKRRWFQFRLSTAVVMLFAIAVFLWLNTQPHSDFTYIFGWPFRAATTHIDVIMDGHQLESGCFVVAGIGFYSIHLIYNVLIALTGTISVGLLIEFIARRLEVRRREGLKP